jgi:hypothetical protein
MQPLTDVISSQRHWYMHGWPPLCLIQLQTQPMVRTNYIVIYCDFSASGRGSGQAKPKPSRHWRLWPGLKILKAKAVESRAKAAAFRPSRAGTSLAPNLKNFPGPGNICTFWGIIGGPVPCRRPTSSGDTVAKAGDSWLRCWTPQSSTQ